MTVQSLLAEREQWQKEREGLLRQQERDAKEIARLTKLIGALRQKLFGTGQGEKVDHAQLQIQLGLAEAELTGLYSRNQEREDGKVDEVVAQVQTEQLEEEPVQRVKRFSLPDDIEEREERIVPDDVLANPENFREIGQPEVTRPSKLGMKNWLFVGHPQAGQRAAIILKR